MYKEGEIDDLRLALSQNIPPIALVHTRELPYWNQPAAHAVVVISIENDLVILNDRNARRWNTSRSWRFSFGMGYDGESIRPSHQKINVESKVGYGIGVGLFGTMRHEAFCWMMGEVEVDQFDPSVAGFERENFAR